MQDTWAPCQPLHLSLLKEKSRSPACSVPQFPQRSEERHQMGSWLHTGFEGSFSPVKEARH